ncbi:hypothetical protein [Pseudobacteriovorax antillogorgiicola]|uniref:Uncharacterized protein n=1 Tax=Pseudobacteriovorax antillogorgiicola TaxID=1513793 RepID=A0A1Y6B3G7_9BACT|nr:hypothetical protein [Pseudobacteriovorax antillogorgiicola]TCS59564.1 hypothetical protein EDD56_101484 [Pseudobacteriovorax antillogorgiicola]SME87703.1 hypothetical protein SAMN06296036_1011 [Pseudobacteriovorax antillogorgiicola]
MKSVYFLLAVTATLVVGCGITGTRYINYQGTSDAGGAGGVAFCQAAVDALALGFTSAGCNCHSSTAPTLSGDTATDRLTFLALADSKHQGDPDELVAYLKTQHTGSSAVTGELATGLDDWATSEKDTSICPPAETDTTTDTETDADGA